MKKVLVFLLFLSQLAIGQTKISDMPTYIGDPTGAWVPIVIGSTNRKIDAVHIGRDSISVSPGTTYDTLKWHRNGVFYYYRLVRAGGGSSLDTATVNQLITDSIAAHPPLLVDTTNFTAGSTVDTITLPAFIGKAVMHVISFPYVLQIATAYPPASNEVWVETSTGGVKFGTPIVAGQKVSVQYKHYPLTPFSSIITDLQYVVAASGGTINNGNTTFTISSLIGKRVRVYRGQLLQPYSNTGGAYALFNPSTALFTINPAASTGELFQIQTY